MDMHSKQELTNIVSQRYKAAKKREKSVILNEFCANTGYERKYAIKVLRNARFTSKKKKEKQRRKKPSKYMTIKPLLKKLWETGDYPSGTRLHALLPELVS